MDNEKDNFKEQLLKKSLIEVDALIAGQKLKIAAEKDLKALSRLNSELKTMKDVRDQKIMESTRHVPKPSRSKAKQDLKSYEDYVKSKKDN